MEFFEYKVDIPTEDGEGMEPVVLRLRPISLVPIGILRHNRNDNEAQMWAMFEWGLPADQEELFDRIPAPEMEKIIAAWQQSRDHGVEVGESSASPTSSTATARPSKRTSSKTD